ncbi:hypothetical protein [Paenibacillus sanfengchensis]|uniref:hypothetical protein n=1 Tax=Paenibacillus sanfengchensis TaxID=3119819 RepID=UPI002FDFFC2D
MNIVDDIIHAVPELNRNFTHYQELSGGLCNQTFKVNTKQHTYVLRLNSRQNEYLNLTRHSEIEVMHEGQPEGDSPRSDIR